MASSTSSIRIPDELKTRLDEAAQSMNKGKNWIINRAIEEYLNRHSHAALKQEAHRQSVLASGKKWKDQALWERIASENWDE